MTGLFRWTIFISAVAHVLYHVESRVRTINLNCHGLSEAPGRRRRFFSPTKPSTPSLEPLQAPIQWVLWFFSGSNRPERECGHLPPSSAEVKMS